jgi:hypothetical protein
MATMKDGEEWWRIASDCYTGPRVTMGQVSAGVWRVEYYGGVGSDEREERLFSGPGAEVAAREYFGRLARG